MSDTRPPLEYLVSCSNAALESLELSRLNRAANLRKELRQKADMWIESEVDARLVRWVLECRRANPEIFGDHGLQLELQSPDALASSGNLILRENPVSAENDKGEYPRALLAKPESLPGEHAPENRSFRPANAGSQGSQTCLELNLTPAGPLMVAARCGATGENPLRHLEEIASRHLPGRGQSAECVALPLEPECRVESSPARELQFAGCELPARQESALRGKALPCR